MWWHRHLHHGAASLAGIANGGFCHFDNGGLEVTPYGAAKEPGSCKSATGVSLSLATASKIQLVARFKSTAAEGIAYAVTAGGEPRECKFEGGKVRVVLSLAQGAKIG